MHRLLSITAITTTTIIITTIIITITTTITITTIATTITIEAWSELREIDLFEWEGQRIADIRARYSGISRIQSSPFLRILLRFCETFMVSEDVCVLFLRIGAP